MVADIKYYFNLWKKNASNSVAFRNYDEWCEANNEMLQEEAYAARNNMDSVHWCWNCRCSECDFH
jgi:hypothetical protein